MSRPTEPLLNVAPRRLHLDYLDSLRGLAALYVVLGHVIVGFDRSRFHWPAAALAEFLDHGRLAVALFIVLSGYCLMLPVAHSGQHKLPSGFFPYLHRRARRIYPAYLAALAFSLAMIAAVPAETGLRSFWFTTFQPAFSRNNLAAHLFLFQNLNNAWLYKINAPFWSVATEWQIYFLFPMVLLPVARRFGIGWMLPISLGISLTPMIVFHSFETAAPWFITLFAMGMLAAWLVRSPHVKPRWVQRHRVFAGTALMAGLALIGTLVMAACMNLGDNWKASLLSQLVLGLAIASGLVWLALSGSTRARACRTLLLWRPFVRLGRFSYSLYLTHALPVCATVMLLSHFAGRLSPTTHFLLALAIGVVSSLGFARLFYIAFERPFVGAGRQADPGTLSNSVSAAGISVPISII
jgi:peptidoglycan/LPS O-acetylase OafA/YrhL